MGKILNQIQLLLWKNWCLRKRHKTRLFMEFAWPLLLFLILMWVRTKGLKEARISCHLIERALPSVGGLEFFQNYFCTLNNTCYRGNVEDQGRSIFKNSFLTKLNTEIGPELQKLVEDNDSMEFVKTLIGKLTDFLKLFGFTKLLSKNNDKVEMRSLIPNENVKSFLEASSEYTGLSSRASEGFLNSSLNLNELDENLAKTIAEKYVSKNCEYWTSANAVIEIRDEVTRREVCDLEPNKVLNLLYIFLNHADRAFIEEKLMDETENFNRDYAFSSRGLGEFNPKPSTISNLLKISGSLAAYIPRSSEYSNGSNPRDQLGLLYSGICGNSPENPSTFGFDPGSANNMDSLRDRLKNFENKGSYEPDPDVSVVCNSVFQTLEETPFISLFWQQIKPIMRGKILYSPVSPFTVSVMKKVDEKFKSIKQISVKLEKMIQLIHAMRDWFKDNHYDVIAAQEMVTQPGVFETLVNSFGVTLKEDEKNRASQFLKRLSVANFENSLDGLDYFLEILKELFQCINYDKSEHNGFSTEFEAVEAGMELLSHDKLLAVVIFSNDDNSSDWEFVEYKIRMDSDRVDRTMFTRDRLSRRFPRRRPAFDMKYFTSGFLYLQEMIEHSIMEQITNSSYNDVHTYLQQFPYPCYIYDQFIKAISGTFPLFMILSWIYASAMIIKSVVLEKERKLKEVMRVMGLNSSVIWVGWFVESFLILSLSATVLTLILKYGKVIQHSNVIIIWIFMISFTVATITFSFLLSTLFSMANSAAAAGGVIFFLTYLPYNFMRLWIDYLQWYTILCGCFISNIAFGFGCNYLARLEEDGIGAQWSSISFNRVAGEKFNMAYCIIMLWLDSILYLVLTIYIESVFPGKSGIPKPWNFFLKKSYWLENSAKFTSNLETKPPIQEIKHEGPGDTVEISHNGLREGVIVSKLCKKYPNGKIALKNLSVTFYEDQITSFLGHNGAGKTTCISILTGLFPATSGAATIYGRDVRYEMDEIRTDLGFCPQHNVLFDRLTVKEHMQFYASLKGRLNEEFEEEVNKMLLDLGIPEKENEYPRNLSGGMKRKLSIAIAFIGQSKCVFLDEPTSGVDPHSRRSIWEMLLKYKAGRCIILTTHFMDEADILGDRIAIISQGQLKACGSSLFLKSKFGQGYTLRLVRKDSFLSSSPSLSKKSLRKAIQDQISGLNLIVLQRIPGASIVESVGFEIVILLPYDSLNVFPAVFEALDDSLDSLGISSYGLSDTTLEDVFLKITIEDLEDSYINMDVASQRRCSLLFNRLMRFRKTKNTVANCEEIFDESVAEKESNVKLETDSLLENNFNDETERKLDQENALLQDPAKEDALNMEMFPNEFIGERSAVALSLIQIYAIIYKRFINSSRNIKAVFLEIILPAVFIALTLAFTLILPPGMDELPREMSPWTYPPPNDIFFSVPVESYSRNQPITEFSGLLDELFGPLGIGTACVERTLHQPSGAYATFEHCDRKNWSNDTVQEFNLKRREYTEPKLPKCNCDTGSLQCTDHHTFRTPPRLELPTSDSLYDVSKLKISEWIEKTYQDFQPVRHGGFEFQIREQLPTFDFNRVADSLTSLFQSGKNAHTIPAQRAEIQSEEQHFTSYKVWFDNKAWVSSVAYLNALHNMMLREKINGQEKNRYGIAVLSHPMNLTDTQRPREYLRTAGIGVLHAICLIFALSFIPASFTVYLIEERICGGKHLHLASGVKPIIYWISNFIFDVCKYTIPIMLCILLFLAFDAKAYVSGESILSFVSLLLLYGWASTPLMYPASFIFSTPSTAFVALACVNLFIGVVTTISTFVLEQFGDEDLESIGEILKIVFLIFPHYCLGRGLMELVEIDLETSIAQDKLNLASKANRLSWKYLGKNIFFLFVEGILFFLLTVMIEYRYYLYNFFKFIVGRLNILSQPEQIHLLNDQDEDVVKEKIRVRNYRSNDAAVLVKDLRKYYPRKKYPAVNELSFIIEKGECFGLLGVNGAGKSSTFKMLTGDTMITSGHASICGFDVKTKRDSARKHFGYCPQEDGIDPLLDAYEQLYLFGMIRGLSKRQTREATAKLIKALGLTKYANRMCGTYSGGNKRKMSTAIALIGDPDVVFLDEPSSGMDPGARQQLWKVILRILRLGKAVVLTSHSMEECEALCSRIAIMVNGQFMCIGSLQHLKNRFGTGYMITVKSPPGHENNLKNDMLASFPCAHIEDFHCSQLKLRIPQEEAKLGNIFKTLHDKKELSLIEGYSISQTTLDDIFVKFASSQQANISKRL